MSTPIKRYNYERSAYRWLLSKHPKQFEKEGLNSISLERAPSARRALYHCSWSGAKKLVRCVEGRFERTVFFDTFINRGLLSGTRFAVEHLTLQEREALGISENSVTGKFYLGHYGLDSPDVVDSSTVSDSQVCMSDNVNEECRKRRASEMERKLWQTIFNLVGPELSSNSNRRQITVTKAMKSTESQTTTQVIIEIDAGEDDSKLVHQKIPQGSPTLQPEPTKHSAFDNPVKVLMNPALGTSGPYFKPLKMQGNIKSESEQSEAEVFRVVPLGDGNNIPTKTSKVKEEAVGMNWGNTKVLDDLEVDILSGLF